MLYNLPKSNQVSSMFPWNRAAPKCVYEREGAEMGVAEGNNRCPRARIRELGRRDMVGNGSDLGDRAWRPDSDVPHTDSLG